MEDEEEDKPKRKYATIYLDEGYFYARWCLDDQHWDGRMGFTENNILQLVKVLTDRGYHVTLFRVSNPQYFAETKPDERIDHSSRNNHS